MNGKKAKAIRRKVYKDRNYRERTLTEKITKRYRMPDGSILDCKTSEADFHRRIYQKMKKAYNNGI